MSIIVHLALLLAYVLLPKDLFRSAETAVPVQQSQQPLRFVEVVPLKDKSLAPLLRADQSDLDRRAATREKAPNPDNTMPFSRGNTPEMVEGGPKSPPEPAPPSPAPAASAPATSASLPDMASRTPVSAPTPERSSNRGIADSLHNLQQYLKNENYDNLKGGNAEQSADIQFDSMGVDFGPWLRRFKNQVERNWIVPASAMTYRGRVVIQFNVLRNGTITDFNVIQPAGYPALTSSALSALKLSNPTANLPPEYPAEKVFFTVTFHYNEDLRGAP